MIKKQNKRLINNKEVYTNNSNNEQQLPIQDNYFVQSHTNSKNIGEPIPILDDYVPILDNSAINNKIRLEMIDRYNKIPFPILHNNYISSSTNSERSVPILSNYFIEFIFMF